MSSSNYRKLNCVQLSSDFNEATQVVEAPLKVPGSDEVLVKILYAGTNAVDLITTSGKFSASDKFPFDIGLEGVGVVEAVGENVSFKVGQHVSFLGSGAYSEHIYLAPHQLIAIPEAKAEYVALLICGLTASIGLDKFGRIVKEDKVLITAAAGGTGHICVQWAKSKGCHVIGTCSSKEKVEFLEELGCDRVINYKKESIDDVLKSEYPCGVDVIWETIGDHLDMLFTHLAKNGRMVVIGWISKYKTGEFPQLSSSLIPAQLAFNSLTLCGMNINNHRNLYPEYSKKLSDMLISGALKIKLDFGSTSKEGPFIGIQSVVRAVEHLHSSKNIGKVVVNISKQ